MVLFLFPYLLYGDKHEQCYGRASSDSLCPNGDVEEREGFQSAEQKAVDECQDKGVGDKFQPAEFFQ